MNIDQVSFPRGTARAAALLTVVLWASAAGCTHQLRATPNLYRNGKADPWAGLPESCCRSNVEVVYVTDRGADSNAPRRWYGFQRSRSVEFGICEVCIGDGMSWDELCRQSRNANRIRGISVAAR